MSIVWISGLLLALGLFILAIVSWVILLSGKFRSWLIIPSAAEEESQRGKKWFIIQSLSMVMAGIIVLMRAWQKSSEYSDNVSENLIYVISGFLLFRAVGEFKAMGLFRTENHGKFTQLDRKFYTPIAIILFLLSLVLI
jgi:hypothetical protein